jgi:hypothetical protein
MNRFKFLGFIVVFLFLISSSFSAIEVFSNYETNLTINTDNTITINKLLTIKNVYDVGIVPGQVEFKVAKGVDGSIEKINIKNVSAYDSFGNKINTHIRTTKDYSVIVLDVYYPLLPNFEYTFRLNYKIDYKPNGIFFKSLEVPIRESTIPIESGKFTVKLPKNYHFTYTHANNTIAYVNNNVAVWNIKNNEPKAIAFEYSYIPVRVGDFKGSYVFWISINIILLLILIYEVRKEIKRIRREYGYE